MKEQEDDRASRPDADNPEWTEQDFQNARPALEVISELMGSRVAENLRRNCGRIPLHQGLKPHGGNASAVPGEA